MHKIRLIYKDYIFSFDSGTEDPIIALGEGKAKAQLIAATLHSIPQLAQLKPADFEIHVDWHDPQLCLFTGQRVPDHEEIAYVPGAPALSRP